MSLNKSKCMYSSNCLHFLKRTVPVKHLPLSGFGVKPFWDAFITPQTLERNLVGSHSFKLSTSYLFYRYVSFVNNTVIDSIFFSIKLDLKL